MLNHAFNLKLLLGCLLSGLSINAVHAQTGITLPEKKELYAEIAHRDSVLFDAFNTPNIDRLKSFFTPDLEIYQDNVGVRNYPETIEAFKDLFKKEYILTRTIVKGSMEVYPIKGYGAIQTGLHTFCHTENGKPQCGTFKFVHIWEKFNGNWKIKRLITYDH